MAPENGNGVGHGDMAMWRLRWRWRWRVECRTMAKRKMPAKFPLFSIQGAEEGDPPSGGLGGGKCNYSTILTLANSV